MKYLYELHCHVSESSKCSSIKAADMVKFYHSIGYSGICITDHFLNGNTTVPDNIPWKEQIELFCKGYENAKNEGDKLGMDVFFGWEFSIPGGTHFLTYGLSREWLIAHPEIMSQSLSEYYYLVHRDGGYIYQAHPFREAEWIDMIKLSPRNVDGVEIFNANQSDFVNTMASLYANSYCLPTMAGSDNHSGRQERICTMAFDEKAKSMTEICELINAHKGTINITSM